MLQQGYFHKKIRAMTFQMSFNIPKWFVYLLCPLHQPKEKRKGIQTIWVENPKLTASFYKQYLGFYIVAKKNWGSNNAILIYRMGNWIWLKSAFNQPTLSGINQEQKVTLRIRNIETEYLNGLDRLMITKHLDLSMVDRRLFIAKDCNGTEIVYCSDISN
jgi:hypothetical protein